MPKTTFAGHPLHPQLVSFPAALLPTSFVFDLLSMVTRKKGFADCAYYTMVAGYAGGAMAAGAGASDYFSIPPKTHTKRIANIHALMNASLMGLYSFNLMSRKGRDHVPFSSFIMSLIGTAGLSVSAWYGGHLVYAHGMRVQGKGDMPEAKEVKLPQDKSIEEMFVRIEEKVGVRSPE